MQTRPCGDTGLLVELDDNAEVHALAGAVRAAGIPGVVELVPALETLLVVYDPRLARADRLAARLRELPRAASALGDGREVEVPVRYDGEDLAFVARHTGLSEREVVAAHTGVPWRVAFCGFAPGFSYLVGGDPRLEVPRRDESRLAVPPGAVALAGRFASVYPRRSPGGWQLVGHTALSLWDQDAEPPALLVPGRRVRFVEVAA
ncbi:MAG TPA: allophanate hydrolase subunit 1 [Nocardioides sp.]|nr:allophanate hydrolase subunit 1 [Nocardioides sp.]